MRLYLVLEGWSDLEGILWTKSEEFDLFSYETSLVELKAI